VPPCSAPWRSTDETGADADEARAVRDDPAALQLLIARKTGNFKRGNER
jgi:hypothetical protein